MRDDVSCTQRRVPGREADRASTVGLARPPFPDRRDSLHREECGRRETVRQRSGRDARDPPPTLQGGRCCLGGRPRRIPQAGKERSGVWLLGEEDELRASEEVRIPRKNGGRWQDVVLFQPFRGASQVLPLCQLYLLRVEDRDDLLQSVDLIRRLVFPDSFDAREPEGVTAVVPIALLDAIEGHLEDYLRLDGPPVPVILDRQLLDSLGHRIYFAVRQTRVGFPDRPEAVPLPDGESVVADHAGAFSVPVLSRHDHSVYRVELLLQLHPALAALPHRVDALRVLEHEPFVPKLPTRGKSPRDLLGPRHCDPLRRDEPALSNGSC